MDFFDGLDYGGMDSANTNFDFLSALQDGGGGGMDSSNTNFDPALIQAGQVNGDPGGGGMDSSNTNFGGLPGQQANNPYGSLAGLGSTSSGGVSDFLKAIGGVPGLLSLLGPLLGGVMASSASKNAAGQQQAAAQKANDQATALMGGSGAAYKPYQDAGGAALGKLQGMNWTPLSGQFADPHAASIAAQFQHNATPLAPTMSSPGMGRMATLASLGGR